MAFFSGRFEPIEASEDVSRIYRIRDNDPEMRNKKIQLMNVENLLNINSDAPYDTSFYHFLFYKLDDPVYNSLTEEEKIENGLPTKFALMKSTPVFMFLQFSFLGKKNV